MSAEAENKNGEKRVSFAEAAAADKASRAGGDPSRPATEAQVRLALQLYTETDYVRRYTEAELRKLSCVELSDHIAKVKDWKLARSQQSLEAARVSGFDKISFAMVYKLVWRDAMEKWQKELIGKETFLERCNSEYQLFKEAADYCKQKVQDGGQQ